MKFNIFKWWESWIKPIIYTIILVATAILITGYCFIKDDGGTLAFAISLAYALVLFLVTIPINRINNYIAEKLYERETFYLTLMRLRDVTNSTIKKADVEDLKTLRELVVSFQTFTGREANMVEQRIKGIKIPVYVKEKGFIYTSEMLQLETKFLKLYDEDGNKKILLQSAKKLIRYYKKSCKHLEKTYNRIAQVYGGALIDLIERDNAALDTEYSLTDIGSKVNDLVSGLNLLGNDLESLASSIVENQRILFNVHDQFAKKLMEIEDGLLDLANKDGNASF